MAKPNPEQKTKRKRPKGMLIFGLVALVGLGAYGAIARPWEPKRVQVALETIAPQDISQVLAVNGRIAAKNSVTVRAAVSAKALTVAADTGDTVEKGQVLVELDKALADAQWQQARAALNAQKVKESQSKATAERAQALGENASRSTREDAELSLSAAIAETARLQAALEQADAQLKQYTITAPISGVVLSRGVDLGQLVDTQGELFSIADLSDLVVETDVDELYSSRVAEGLKVLLKPVGASVAQHGTVTFAAPTVDASTGGRAIKIGFDEAVDLPVGLTVNANVIVEEVSGALSVPRRAIITEGAQSHVMLANAGVAEARPIEFNDWPAERVIVTSGLNQDDVVILDPAKVEAGTLVAE
ncbi:efflux RND transporter periplasmic adaptor subunit [Devosia sp. MC532]|uniref:efflux RND transporter periplasmic adaptor subunit n=1 Tax=Devosia sp. MC532 TaxID=2799788 RepID=UPI0018F3978B|nr:efflux RND transporter periplasmic adaptor subunit [Devosia sp. MC532]